jgi:hypothetical protein
MQTVNRHTRASRNGKPIVCPHCHNTVKIYHFNWCGLLLEHADRESIAEATAWRDWNQVSKWNTDDWNIERSTILPRIQQMRFKIVNAAIKKGQLQTAVMCLKDIGAVIGEVAPEQQAMLAPILNITVEESRPKNLSSGSEPVNITPALESVPENLSLDAE